MELAEIIKQFKASDVRPVFNTLAISCDGIPDWLTKFPKDDYYEREWVKYPKIREVLLTHRLDSYSTEIEKYLATINEARAAQMLSENNKTKIQIDNKEHLHCAVVLSLIPTEALEEVAIANNVVIPDESESGFRSFIPGVNKDIRRWALIKKMAEEMSNPVSSGRQLFCPQCEIDIPSEADYCMSCGRERPQVACPKCETANPPQAKFCMGCGEER
tara:strand:+ start:568 stop:1218 length:651 start_codon:yes stop_codon:yes gene_type:complete